MDEFSVVSADDFESVRARVERIHHEFDEPVLVERYIGGKDAQELTVPMLISHDGRVAKLPIRDRKGITSRKSCQDARGVAKHAPVSHQVIALRTP